MPKLGDIITINYVPYEVIGFSGDYVWGRSRLHGFITIHLPTMREA
jgi:hypothetical protein